MLRGTLCFLVGRGRRNAISSRTEASPTTGYLTAGILPQFIHLLFIKSDLLKDLIHPSGIKRKLEISLSMVG